MAQAPALYYQLLLFGGLLKFFILQANRRVSSRSGLRGAQPIEAFEVLAVGKIATSLVGIAMAAVFSTAAGAQVVLKASHQFPGDRGDARDEMIQIIARDVKAANVGLEIQVHSGATLFKPNEQWSAMVEGRLDISSFPLDYASGKVPVFGATLMPGLVRNHDRALRLNKSPFMQAINARIERAGVVVLADAWLAGAVAARKTCTPRPEDMKGARTRSAGAALAALWAQ